MIEVCELEKSYRGRRGARVQALAGVSFRCEPGEVYGLLGPNGAGKTTALRILSTALRPSGGSGRVMGLDLVTHAAEVRRRIGFLSASTGLYDRLTAREVLLYFGRLYGLAPGELAARIEELAEFFRMREFLERPCEKLSTGMRQKVNIARTVLHSPPVLILDEPTSGLDVLTSRAIFEFVRRAREEGRTVLFSTHILSEARKLCDRLAVIHEGRIRFTGTVAELAAHSAEGDLDDAFVRLVEAGAA